MSLGRRRTSSTEVPRDSGAQAFARLAAAQDSSILCSVSGSARLVVGRTRPRARQRDWAVSRTSAPVEAWLTLESRRVEVDSRGRACALDVSGRSERIRTFDPCLPKAVLYQAELHSEPSAVFCMESGSLSMVFFGSVGRARGDAQDGAGSVAFSIRVERRSGPIRPRRRAAQRGAGIRRP